MDIQHKHCYTQALLHTKALHTRAFTRKSLYTQTLETLSHADAFRRRSLHRDKRLSQTTCKPPRHHRDTTTHPAQAGSWEPDVARPPFELTTPSYHYDVPFVQFQDQGYSRCMSAIFFQISGNHCCTSFCWSQSLQAQLFFPKHQLLHECVRQ